jgi:DNA-binding MarR family transcriptional regulator
VVLADSSEHHARALASVELKAHHVGVLNLVQDGSMPQSRLSERLSIFKPAIVAVLRDLEEQRLVQRQPHLTDGRALVIHLLPLACASSRSSKRPADAPTDEFFAPLTPQERRTFHDLARQAGRPHHRHQGMTCDLRCN